MGGSCSTIDVIILRNQFVRKTKQKRPRVENLRQWWDRIEVIILSMGYGEVECIYLVNSRILCRLQ